MNSEEQRWFTLPLVESFQPHARGKNGMGREEVVQQFNLLLRGEISATEIYRMAIDKLMKDGQDPSRVATLREIQREHIRAAQVFRKRISELGGLSEESSGNWGIKVAMGAAQLFGDNATLHALRDSEEHGLKEMQASLEHLDADSAELVERAMMPGQAKHIRRITSLIEIVNG
jgi:hypothetical protein